MKKLFILFLLFSYSAQGQLIDSTAGSNDVAVGRPGADTTGLGSDTTILPPDTSISIIDTTGATADTTGPGIDTSRVEQMADTIPDPIDTISTEIRNLHNIILINPSKPVIPGFQQQDTTEFETVEPLMPLPFESETEVAYEEKFPIETPELKLERKKPVWLYPQYFWRKGIITGFNFSQASFSNWAAGGENNLNLITFASIYFRKSTLRYEWENLIDAAYGVQSFRGLDVIRKSEDRLEFTSKIGHKTAETLFTSFLFNFKSQFDIGYNYQENDEREKVSNFMAPGYITTSLGLDYKPSKAFSLLVSPIAGKITLVMDQELADQGAFGVPAAVLDTLGNVITPGKNSRSQLGMGLNARLSKELGKNIVFNSKLDMFSDYEKPTSVDISWDNSIIFKVNNAISANLSTALIYDEDILIKKDNEEIGKPRVQFKEIFSLGVRFDI